MVHLVGDLLEVRVLKRRLIIRDHHLSGQPGVAHLLLDLSNCLNFLCLLIDILLRLAINFEGFDGSARVYRPNCIRFLLARVLFGKELVLTFDIIVCVLVAREKHPSPSVR